MAGWWALVLFQVRKAVDQQGDGANNANTATEQGLLGLGWGGHSTALSERGVICHIIMTD